MARETPLPSDQSGVRRPPPSLCASLARCLLHLGLRMLKRCVLLPRRVSFIFCALPPPFFSSFRLVCYLRCFPTFFSKWGISLEGKRVVDGGWARVGGWASERGLGALAVRVHPSIHLRQMGLGPQRAFPNTLPGSSPSSPLPPLPLRPPFNHGSHSAVLTRIQRSVHPSTAPDPQ